MQSGGINLRGQKVEHSEYGEGMITNHTATSVTVAFSYGQNIRSFLYPVCFASVLQLMNAKLSLQVKKALSDFESSTLLNGRVVGSQVEIVKPKPNPMYAAPGRARALYTQTEKVVRFPDVLSFCEAYAKAITVEAEYTRNDEKRRKILTDGVLITVRNGIAIYNFESEDELHMPSGTPIRLFYQESEHTAYVIGCEDYTMTLETKNINLGTTVDEIEYTAEPWRLLYELRERLTQLKTKISTIVNALVVDGPSAVERNEKLTYGQDQALKMAISQPITFIWGPPGTGKTQVLANIALSLIAEDKRVLMLSHSNVAVDGALWRTHQLASNKLPGILVRYGFPRDENLLKHKYLTSFNLALQKNPKLNSERESLINQRRTMPRASEEYAKTGRRLAEIRKALSDEEKRLCGDAQLLATTMSKAIVDSTVYSSRYDAVIFDEASMALVPQLVFAASLAQSHFICIGDFRQLPPIVQSPKASLLLTDMFAYCGITESIDRGHGHAWVCMLNTQYRMHSRIADFVSAQMYQGKLKTANTIDKRRKDIVDTYPFPEQALGLVDLSKMKSVCLRTKEQSRFNVLSALIAFYLAETVSKVREVGIVAPYSAQARLLHAMAKDAKKTNEKSPLIACSTVHQFQGSEKEIILYDAVDCYMMRYPGMLLTSKKNNQANRLFNVALTRAKGKFVVIANKQYMDRKKLSSDLMFGTLLNELSATDEYSDEIPDFQDSMQLPNACTTLYRDNKGIEQFDADLLSAKEEVCVEIAGKITLIGNSKQGISQVLHGLKKRRVRVSVRAKEKRMLSKELQSFAIENPFVIQPLTMIDKRIVWYGFPPTDDVFISEGKVIPIESRPVIRFEGRHAAKLLYNFLNMSNLTNHEAYDEEGAEESSDVGYASFDKFIAETLCPSCSNPRRLIHHKGRFFIGCSAYPKCKIASPVDFEILKQYLEQTNRKCPICNSSLKANSGKYGVWVSCWASKEHKVRLNEI